MERLYIDDVLVDLGEETNITLSVISNLFSDVSKLSGNSSYTIKLPRTSVNDSLFGYADRVDSLDAFPVRKHRARFYRNGVEIFNGAEVSLLSASDEGYEITAIWGCRPKFTAMIEKGMSLKDIESTARILFVKQPQWTEADDFFSQGYGYALMRTRWMDDEPTEWHGSNAWGEWDGTNIFITDSSEGHSGQSIQNGARRTFISSDNNHPCVSVAWLLDKIRDASGVEFRWTGDAKTLIDSLIIPCVSKEANELTFEGSAMAAVVSGLPSGYHGMMTLSVMADDNVFGRISGTVQTLTVLTSCELMIHAEMTIRHTWENIFESNYPDLIDVGDYPYVYRSNFAATEININVRHQNDDTDTYRIGNAAKFFVGNLWKERKGFVEVLRSSGTISVEAGDVVSVTLDRSGYSAFKPMNITGGFTAMPVDGSEVPYNTQFPIVENLPDIKVVDFAKFLCAITGTFPIQRSDDGVVEFKAYDVLLDNIADAEDWTDRIIPKASSNIPAKLSFRQEGWARHNSYKWKEDSRTKGSFDGDLVIDDDTLDEQRDVITFPFAASDQWQKGVAWVPLYERKYTYDDDGVLIEDPALMEWEYSKTEPRILQAQGSGHSMVSTRFELNMQEIIAERYGLISGCLNGAKIIQERIRLSDAEISAFDETVPVWLGQYGAYFAVLEIKAGADGLSEVKMIRINMEER